LKPNIDVSLFLFCYLWRFKRRNTRMSMNKLLQIMKYIQFLKQQLLKMMFVAFDSSETT